MSSLKRDKIYINYERLLNIMNSRISFLEEEQKLLANIPYLLINYELDLLETEKHQITCDKIFDFLEVDSVKVNTDINKTTVKNISDFIQNYDEVYHRLAQTQYVELIK